MRILAMDLGTSSVKLMRLDERARVLSIDRVPLSELSVPAWIEALRHNLEQHGDQHELGGIAVTGQMHGLMTRETGDVWGEGIPWHDTRATGLIPTILKTIGPDAHTLTGGPIAPGFLAASLIWLREHHPDRWNRITSVHLPKDALIHELTGEHVTDPSDAAGTGLFAPGEGDWAWSVVDALGIPRAWLARLMPSGSIAGGLRREYAHLLGLPRGLPIILAGGAAPTGAYGAGALRDDDALVMLSTGAQVLLPSRTWSPDPQGRWYTWPATAPGTDGYAPYLRVETLLNAGNVVSWAENVLQDGDASGEPSGLIVLPHLIGTREHPYLTGSILGVDEHTNASTLQRAVIEGIAFSVRSKLEEMGGIVTPRPRLRLGGGLAHRQDVRQLFADVLNTPVTAVAQPEATAYGAGLLALHNLEGLLPDELLDAGEITEPGSAVAYDAAYLLYCDLERALLPFAPRIAALGDDQ